MTASSNPPSEHAIASPRPAEFDVRFVLSASELNEAIASRKTFLNTAKGRICAKLVAALGAVMFFLAPYVFGETWGQLMKTSPLLALQALAFAVLDLWVATGSPGAANLNVTVNRLGLGRQVILSDGEVVLIHGKKKRQLNWAHVRAFQETTNHFILLTGGAMFWAVPKRALAGDEIPRLYSFLKSKLPER